MVMNFCRQLDFGQVDMIIMSFGHVKHQKHAYFFITAKNYIILYARRSQLVAANARWLGYTR